MTIRRALISLATGMLLGSAGFVGAQQLTGDATVPSGTRGNVTINTPYSLPSGASNQVILANGSGWVTLGASAIIEPPPNGSIYHQVVDVYYDAAGQKIDTKSATHLVAGDCTRGRSPNPAELIAQDDGKGHVSFASLLLGSEPTMGQKAVTPQGRVMATLAINRSPAIEALPAERVGLVPRAPHPPRNGSG